MMRLDNLQLSAFAAVLQEGSFDLAARRLSLTPSAVSQRVKALEERIGQVLVQRVAPCRPTPAGQVLLRYASEVALLESEVFAALGNAGEATPLRVRLPVVVNVDSLDSWFDEVLAAVAQDGTMTLDIRTEDQDHSAELLREGIVMAGVSASENAVQGCRVELLGTMRYRAVASPGFMAAHFAQGVSLPVLNQAPMLVFSRKDALQASFIDALVGGQIDPPVHYMPTTHAFLAAARSGLAWGMIPDQMAGEMLATGVLQELAPDKWLDVPLYWHRSKINTDRLALLSRFVQQAASRHLR